MLNIFQYNIAVVNIYTEEAKVYGITPGGGGLCGTYWSAVGNAEETPLHIFIYTAITTEF